MGSDWHILKIHLFHLALTRWRQWRRRWRRHRWIVPFMNSSSKVLLLVASNKIPLQITGRPVLSFVKLIVRLTHRALSPSANFGSGQSTNLPLKWIGQIMAASNIRPTIKRSWMRMFTKNRQIKNLIHLAWHDGGHTQFHHKHPPRAWIDERIYMNCQWELEFP